MSVKIKPGLNGEELRIINSSDEFHIFNETWNPGKVSILYWTNSDSGYEYSITIEGDTRLTFLEQLRDWANDQIWNLQHEEAAV